MMQVLVARLEHTAAAMPTHTAIQKGDRRIDYRGLREAALRLAVALRARGVQPGDRVALSLSNGIEAAIAWYGIWRAGAAVVPLKDRKSVVSGKSVSVGVDLGGRRLIK